MECWTVHDRRKYPWEIIAFTIYKMRSSVRSKKSLELQSDLKVHCHTRQFSADVGGRNRGDV
ncbi:Glucose-1-phosphate adenylyltransferase large subunit 1 [Senna tora]|uniref:Glucose-1-phosphate adenylyltransferase large subunit 1 n=1 Tax=Senna tora TaxID=362788 RepID=A0A834X9Z4_9FABA|nr:Glucose-1-phosphate adenylyltransferase large subunit 1 [Senna tora]